MQPLQYIPFASTAAQRTSTTQAAVAPSNLDAADLQPKIQQARSPATHARDLSSPCSRFLHRKPQSFVSPLPPQSEPHARSMQPLQCVLQHHMSNPHVSAHMVRHQSYIHATAICNHKFQNSLKTMHAHKRIKAASIHHYTAATKKTSKGTARALLTHELPFVAACSQFTRKNARFRAPASSPTQTPCNIHANTPMRLAAAGGKRASLLAHGNKT